MKWNQFFGGVFIGLAFGIMVGVAVAPGSGPDNVSTGTAGFCAMLALTGAVAARGRRRNSPVASQNTAHELPPDGIRAGHPNRTPPGR